jgi:2-keto-3-deoxy-L-rhamnonate aldolase RhmA
VRKTFADLLTLDRAAIGSLLTVAAPFVAEIYSAASLDWIFVDAEHGSLGHAEVLSILQAASIPTLVRCPAHDEGWIKKTLDAGADGLIIPQVKTKDEALKLVKFAKYPPLGERGLGSGRAHGYGKNSKDYISSANKSTSLVLQIEHIEGVKNAEAIMSVPGVDAIFIGPYDLSVSLGIPGDIQNLEVKKSILNLQKIAHAKNMPIGIYAGDAQTAKEYLSIGFNFIALSYDTKFLSYGLNHFLQNLS